jgi:hypothetical protein
MFFYEKLGFTTIFEDPDFMFFWNGINFENSKKVHQILIEGTKIFNTFFVFSSR